MSSRLLGADALAATRLAVAAAAGVAVALLVAFVVEVRYAPVAGWITASAVYLVWTWTAVGRMTPEQTASHATGEDPTRAATGTIMVVASIASLAGVGYVLLAGSAHGGEAEAAAAVGIASVIAAWLIVHTVFALRYARLYYLMPTGGVDFNQDDPPAYVDFAYLAFTIGMTYQVSDTDLQTPGMRATALRQALLSYVLGAVVLATTINLIAGLGTH
ncbi:putative membrane protein [Mycobacterium sp. OAS707]|uniref:DUF1345 domain-containing protein n=1 Tax=Mycobacterium sp. OAS707 TaxID=2663822 RepID=UPI0017890C90|nr:DUF1345 domain-containing protein [Mycobacterium sp. OAS707]MBE1552256.1 putative membrane protein [Mycobacterium sp. OAS707]